MKLRLFPTIFKAYVPSENSNVNFVAIVSMSLEVVQDPNLRYIICNSLFFLQEMNKIVSRAPRKFGQRNLLSFRNCTRNVKARPAAFVKPRVFNRKPGNTNQMTRDIN